MSTPQLSSRTPLPNDFTRAVGQAIRQARLDARLSQRKLAARIDRRQAAISMLEQGQMQPDVTTLVMLAEALDKPIPFFVPPPWGPRVTRGDLDYDEQALLLEFRRLKTDEQRQTAIALLNTLANLSRAG
jgi:transcriptional regulator with XRE-family HTH domain